MITVYVIIANDTEISVHHLQESSNVVIRRGGSDVTLFFSDRAMADRVAAAMTVREPAPVATDNLAWDHDAGELRPVDEEAKP